LPTLIAELTYFQKFDLISVGTPELSFSSEGYLCEDGTSTYIGAKVAPLTYEFSWDSGQTTPGFEVNEPGEYTVTVTNTLNGLSCINTKTVTVIESKSPQILDVQIEDLQDSNTISIIANTDSEWMYQLDGGDLQASNKFFKILYA